MNAAKSPGLAAADAEEQLEACVAKFDRGARRGRDCPREDTAASHRAWEAHHPIGVSEAATAPKAGEVATRWSEHELAELHGMGPKALSILKAALKGGGRCLRAS